MILLEADEGGATEAWLARDWGCRINEVWHRKYGSVNCGASYADWVTALTKVFSDPPNGHSCSNSLSVLVTGLNVVTPNVRLE
jgi:hypothetical protein